MPRQMEGAKQQLLNTSNSFKKFEHCQACKDISFFINNKTVTKPNKATETDSIAVQSTHSFRR